jgi:hypothetical protein
MLGFSLLCAGLSQPPARAAEQQHLRVVSAVPAASTPHIQADAEVPHPLALAIFQSGNTIYVGGKFNSVQNINRTATF